MLPKVNHRIVVQTLTSDFRAATKFIDEPIGKLGKRDMLIKNVACGINASDVNFASGAYLPGVQVCTDESEFSKFFWKFQLKN